MTKRRDNITRQTSTSNPPIRSVPAAIVLAATLGLSGTAGIVAAADTDSTGAAVDERVGLLDHPWRLWRIPVRYSASRSPYFQPGLPPYRQQPEKAQQQLPDAGESATETAPPSPSPSSSNTSEDASKSPPGGSEGPSSGASESSTPPLTLIEPIPTFTPIDPAPQPGDAPTPTPTPSGP